MQDNYVVAGKGLQYMFWGAVVGLVGTFIPLVGVIMTLVGGLMMLYGLYTAMNTQENYKTAMYMVIAGVVLSVLGAIFSKGILHILVSVVGSVASFLVVYYICTATAALLTSKGDQAQADKAKLVIALNLVCTVVDIVCTLVGWIPVVNILAGAASILSGLVAIVACVLQLIFYYKSSQSLLA